MNNLEDWNNLDYLTLVEKLNKTHSSHKMNKLDKFLFWFLSASSKFIKSDELYVKMQFYLSMHKKLNLNPPQTFNEKLQWLKLHDRHESHTQLVDKYEVKKVVEKLLGKEFIIPTIGIYNNFDEIDANSLPDKFVIKCTHNSGNVCICKDKKTFDWNVARKKITKSLKHNFFWTSREYPYKNVKPRIIIEENINDSDTKSINDYKFFCFNGEPKMLLIASNREVDVKFDLFDMEFNHCPFKKTYDNLATTPLQKPALFEELKEVAAKLSKGFPHVRIDLYQVGNKIYFGEYTFFDNAGYEGFVPEKWDTIIGDWIDLSKCQSTK